MPLSTCRKAPSLFVICAALGLIVVGVRAEAARRHKNPKALDDDFSLLIALDKESYRLGEAAVCEVTLRNETKTTITALALNHETLRFSFYPRASGPPATRLADPVASPKEDTLRVEAYGPERGFSRRFLFTRLTLRPGERVLRCAFSTPTDAAPDEKRTFHAWPVSFTVEPGEPVVERQGDGLITRKAAEAIAEKAAGGAAREADSQLVIDERGFHKWWVNVRVARDDGATTVSYFIDPYRGAVWAEAKPFEPSADGGPTPLPPDSPLRRKIIEQKRIKNFESGTTNQEP